MLYDNYTGLSHLSNDADGDVVWSPGGTKYKKPYRDVRKHDWQKQPPGINYPLFMQNLVLEWVNFQNFPKFDLNQFSRGPARRSRDQFLGTKV